MELKDIVAINGKPGLYEIKAQSKGGIIVESLLDGKRINITVTHNISALNEIAIYTYERQRSCGRWGGGICKHSSLIPIWPDSDEIEMQT